MPRVIKSNGKNEPFDSYVVRLCMLYKSVQWHKRNGSKRYSIADSPFRWAWSRTIGEIVMQSLFALDHVFVLLRFIRTFRMLKHFVVANATTWAIIIWDVYVWVDQYWMQQAIELAKRGLYSLIQMLGAWLSKIIRSLVKPKSWSTSRWSFCITWSWSQGATAYVTLEPCAHYGRRVLRHSWRRRLKKWLWHVKPTCCR